MNLIHVLKRSVASPTAARTLAYYLAFVAVGMATASFGPSIPSLAANTGETLARVGALFVFHRIGYISGSLSSGKLVDRVSGTLVTGIALLIIALGLVGQTFEHVGSESFVRIVWASQIIALAAFCTVLLAVRVTNAGNRPTPT